MHNNIVIESILGFIMQICENVQTTSKSESTVYRYLYFFCQEDTNNEYSSILKDF